MAFARDINQSTGNRKLKLLGELGLAEREVGKKQSAGRRWRATLPDETKKLLLAALDLSDAVAARHRVHRDSSRRSLNE